MISERIYEAIKRRQRKLDNDPKREPVNYGVLIGLEAALRMADDECDTDYMKQLNDEKMTSLYVEVLRKN